MHKAVSSGTLYLTATLGLTGCVSEPAADVVCGGIIKSELPLHRTELYVYTDAVVASSHVNMIVDTGANRSILIPKFAAESNLKTNVVESKRLYINKKRQLGLKSVTKIEIICFLFFSRNSAFFNYFCNSNDDFKSILIDKRLPTD